MSSTTGARWTEQRERGSQTALRMMVWLALTVGRPACRVLLWPICIYFLLTAAPARRASAAYLARVLGRRPRAADRLMHMHYFASCLLDRVYMLNNRFDAFAFNVIATPELIRQLEGDAGLLLFGAHIGSFEAIRAAGRRTEKPMALMMYEENARKTKAVLDAINPALALEIVSLGRPGAMLTVISRLESGHLVGLLADRDLSAERQTLVPFLGSAAPFPAGPFRMAALIGVRPVLMLGLWRGGNRYDIHFEAIEGDDEAAMLLHYAARLAHHCLAEPYAWANFYPFWGGA